MLTNYLIYGLWGIRDSLFSCNLWTSPFFFPSTSEEKTEKLFQINHLRRSSSVCVSFFFSGNEREKLFFLFFFQTHLFIFDSVTVSIALHCGGFWNGNSQPAPLQFHVLQKAVICCKPADLRSLFALRNPFSLLFTTFTLPQLIPMINAFSPFVWLTESYRCVNHFAKAKTNTNLR